MQKTDPLGVCSLTDGERLVVVCPARFLEDGRVFQDVGRIAFGAGKRLLAVPEVHILKVTKTRPDGTKRDRRIGKVDHLVAKLDEGEKPVDFAALEVQAVYISGHSMRGAFTHFLKNHALPPDSERRPDWRSSAQKRLVPQLLLKIPVFRRWGKKVFVAVDSRFFDELPRMNTTDSLANSEVTWLAYPFARAGCRFTIGDPAVTHTIWDEVMTALREGVAPSPAEILAEIVRKKEMGKFVEKMT